ncbi:transcriptional regulator [Arthrobacter sp. SD76]|uniref:transcriptional regulator n=1 Tax=Arthrobacter sp. SD76 TaxID=3415007 RepID=UPI003C73EE6C
MNESEALKHLGHLIQIARVEIQRSQNMFAKDIGLNVQTLRAMERGDRMVQDLAQAKVERGLGWKTGAIREVMEDRENLAPDMVTLEELRRGAGEPTFQEMENGGDKSRVMKASHLSDEELLAELSYRFRNYRVQINGES